MTEDKKICKFPKCKRHAFGAYCEKHQWAYNVFMLIKKGVLNDLYGKRLGRRELLLITNLIKDELTEIEDKYRARSHSCRRCINFIRIERMGSAFTPQGVCGLKQGEEPYLSSSEARDCKDFEEDLEKGRITDNENLWRNLMRYYTDQIPNPIFMMLAGKLAEGITPKEALLGTNRSKGVIEMIVRHKEEMDAEVKQMVEQQKISGRGQKT